jgi:hypothetical protein
MVNWNLCPSPFDIVAGLPVAAMPTHIILAAVGLVPLSKMTPVHHSRPVRQCTLQPPVGRQQTVLAHPILLMVPERRLGMPLHVLLILTVMGEGHQHGMLVLGRLILMRQDLMGVP